MRSFVIPNFSFCSPENIKDPVKKL